MPVDVSLATRPGPGRGVPLYLTAEQSIYTGADLRAPWADVLQAGVKDASSFGVVQRAAGANMSVDVGATSVFSVAWVAGTSITNQGLYRVDLSDALNVTISANSSGNPRLDQVYLAVADQESAGANNKAYLDVAVGTPTTGATLDNRSGAAALPATSIRLADVIVASGASSIVTANLRDRRPWARGAYCVASSVAGDFSITATSAGTTAGANRFRRRLEIISGLVEVTLILKTSNASGTIQSATGVLVNGSATGVLGGNQIPAGATVSSSFPPTPCSVTPGTALLDVYAYTSSGTITALANAASPAIVVYREVLRPDASNGVA